MIKKLLGIIRKIFSLIAKALYYAFLSLLMPIAVYLIYYSIYEGRYFLLNIFLQIIASIFIIIFTVLAKNEVIRYCEKKDIKKEIRINVESALDSLSHSSKNYLAHISSLIISLLFSFTMIGIFFKFSLYLIGIGVFLIVLPIFYLISSNVIIYKRIYAARKKSRPVLAPLMSLPYVFMGLVVIITDLAGKTGNIIQGDDYGKLAFLYIAIAIILSLYFKFMQKLDITYRDVEYLSNYQ